MKTIILISLYCACFGTLTNADEIRYPYHATSARRANILDGAKQVRVGMTAKDIEALFGVPNERNDTFDHIKASEAHKVGYSYVYLLQRLRPDGSVAQKGEKLLRLHFGLDNHLNRIDDYTK